MKDNRINIGDLGNNYRKTIAKCGTALLNWIACPLNPRHWFEVVSGCEIILETEDIYKAISKYNELVERGAE